MATPATRPSRALGTLLRSRRHRFGWTLKETSERCAHRGDPVPISTLARIERGQLDPGVRRLHLLLRIYRVPPHLVADLVELEQQAVAPPPTDDLEQLYRDGVEHWKAGDAAQGLACLMAVREAVPDDDASRTLRQKATLVFCIAARDLGKYRLAKQIVDDLLCEPPEATLLPRVLVLAASLWRRLGSVESALAYVRQAASHIGDDDGRDAAYVHHDHAKLLSETGNAGEAERHLERALAIYRAHGDTYGAALALGMRVSILEGKGDLEGAREAAREAIAHAERHDHPRVAIAAKIELGRILVASGAAKEGLDVLRGGLGEAVRFDDKDTLFFAHYHLWKAYDATGDKERARVELEVAMYFVRSVEDASPEADEVRRLMDDEDDPHA